MIVSYRTIHPCLGLNRWRWINELDREPLAKPVTTCTTKFRTTPHESHQPPWTTTMKHHESHHESHREGQRYPRRLSPDLTTGHGHHPWWPWHCGHRGVGIDPWMLRLVTVEDGLRLGYCWMGEVVFWIFWWLVKSVEWWATCFFCVSEVGFNLLQNDCLKHFVWLKSFDSWLLES